MMIEQEVARHYAHGSLEVAIFNALAAAGKDLDHLSLKDLSPVDEFHIGGRLATIALAKVATAAALEPERRTLVAPGFLLP